LIGIELSMLGQKSPKIKGKTTTVGMMSVRRVKGMIMSICMRTGTFRLVQRWLHSYISN
jgi:hypothetical protein